MREVLAKYIDIVDLITSTYFPLKKVTPDFVGGVYEGFCPFHEQKHQHPTFSVSNTTQTFYCQQCKAQGDLVTFVARKEEISEEEAMDRLASKANLPLDPESDGFNRRKQMFNAHDLAAKYYHHILMNTEHGEPGRRYLESRGISQETMEVFQLGFAPDSWHVLGKFLHKRGFEPELLCEAGLVNESESSKGRFYDCFRGRVMFPISDERGRVIGFGGRALGEGVPKYMNTKETPIFQKRRTLFNQHRAHKRMQTENKAILLEGYMDVLKAHQNGIQNVVAALGTALTEEHVGVLHQQVQELVMVFDGDNAGQEAVKRSSEVVRDMTASVATIPDNLDPDEFLEAYGRESFLHVVESAQPIVLHLMLEMRKSHDLSNQQGKEIYKREVVEKVLINVSDRNEQDGYVQFLKVLANQ